MLSFQVILPVALKRDKVGFALLCNWQNADLISESSQSLLQSMYRKVQSVMAMMKALSSRFPVGPALTNGWHQRHERETERILNYLWDFVGRWWKKMFYIRAKSTLLKWFFINFECCNFLMTQWPLKLDLNWLMLQNNCQIKSLEAASSLLNDETCF